jgi:D-amino-acid dehydrogenase
MKIAVVGCGLVGLACAHALADAGHEVTLFDKEGPGAGASRGNAGWLAHTDILPIASPEIWRKLPKYLLDPLGPLAIRRAYLPQLLPWLARFMLAARPGAIDRSVKAMAELQTRALPAWERLARALGLEAMLRRAGGLYVFERDVDFERAKPLFARQRGLGMRVDFLSKAELARMEPALAPAFPAAAFFPDAAHVADPRLLTQALFEAAARRGMAFRREEVRSIATRTGGGVELSAGARTHVDHAVIAAGAWSKPLAASLGDRIPLDTERGYNVSFPGLNRLLSRPVSFEGHGFVATPLDTGLRIGGAVELGGLDLAPNHRRTRALYEKARRFIHDLPPFESGSVWMGFRPSLPDSLPVIGPSRATRSVLYAFGHGHYGLTQAALTGEIVRDLVSGRAPAIDLSPYRPERF